MKLFLKHWCRSVRRSPLQPLLILLTVVLAVALGVTAFRMQFLLVDISKQASADEASLGDVILSMRGDSHVRMMFEEDVKDILGDDINAQMLGEYALTAFYKTENGTHPLSLGGVDLENADRYFLFEYLEYGAFTSQNLKQSAILSRSAAERYGLRVGDSIVLQVMGEDIPYTVQAIASNTGLLKERDVLVSVHSLIDVLAKQFPTISVMGVEFEPYNRILLRFDVEGQAQIAIERLSDTSLFADKQITLTDSLAREDFLLFMQRSAMLLISIVLLLLCGLLISTCLQLLQIQRSAEFAFFYSIGASKNCLALVQLLESGIYALLGSIGGIFLAHPMLNFAWDLFHMPIETVFVGALGAISGIGFSLILMLGCTALSLYGQKQLTVAEWVEKEESLERPSEGKYLWLPFALIMGGCILTMMLVSVKWRYLPGIFVIVSCIALLYFVLPSVLRGYAGIMECLLSKGKRPKTSFLLASKNLKQQFALRHVGRLLTALVSILVLVSACSKNMHTHLEMVDHVFKGDLIAVNAPEDAEEKLKNMDGIEGIARFDMVTSAEIEGGYTVMAIMASGKLDPILSQYFLPDRMPEKEEAVISKGIAALTDTKVGEQISIALDGGNYVFTVSQIQNVQSNFIFLNKEAIPTARDLMGIALTEEAKANGALQSAIYECLDSQGVVLLNAESLRPASQGLLKGFSDLLKYATVIAVIVSLAGCVNLLAGQLRARKRERSLLRMCGMTNKAMLRMYLSEAILLFVPILLIGLLVGAGLCVIMHFGLLSFGISLFTF